MFIASSQTAAEKRQAEPREAHKPDRPGRSQGRPKTGPRDVQDRPNKLQKRSSERCEDGLMQQKIKIVPS